MAKPSAFLHRHFMQSRVVHHLPGRLRLHVPVLERVSSEWHKYAAALIEIIKLKEGIEGVQLRTTSGSVLVWYDPALTDRSDILAWFRKLTLWLYNGYTAEPFRSTHHMGPFLKKMHARVKGLLHFDRHDNEDA